MNEKKDLIRINRDQAKQLAGHENIKGPDGIIISIDGCCFFFFLLFLKHVLLIMLFLTPLPDIIGQIKVLNEKNKKLYLQVSELRQREQAKSDEIEILKKYTIL